MCNKAQRDANRQIASADLEDQAEDRASLTAAAGTCQAITDTTQGLQPLSPVHGFCLSTVPHMQFHPAQHSLPRAPPNTPYLDPLEQQ